MPSEKKLSGVVDAYTLGMLDSDTVSALDDGVGKLLLGFVQMKRLTEKQIDRVNEIAGGDLTREVPLRTDQDHIGIALNKMLARMNRALVKIRVLTAHISEDAQQVSAGNTVLARNAKNQAASMAQIGKSALEIEGCAKLSMNAANAIAGQSAAAIQSAMNGCEKTQQAVQSADDIRKAAHCIEKMNKVVAEIAAQSDMIAQGVLANTEGATFRNGDAAVIAKRLRGLAERCAETSAEIAVLVCRNIESAEHGFRLTQEAGKLMEQTVAGIREINESMEHIVNSSHVAAEAAQLVCAQAETAAAAAGESDEAVRKGKAILEELQMRTLFLTQMNAQFRLNTSHEAETQPGEEEAIQPKTLGRGQSAQIG